MTSNDSPIHPPRTPAWFVEVFASPHEADGILGDLAEEFSASVARDGNTEARRRYRRQAWRTIRDLALSPWSTRPSAGSRTFSGLALAMGIGVTGLVVTFPIGMAARLMTFALVSRYPIYDYVPAFVFWGIVQFFSPLMGGFIVALIARGIRFRPMTAGLALVVATAVLLAVDMPILMLLYGAPMRTVTLSWWTIRWVRGVLMFGGVMLTGAAIGRMAPFPDIFVPLRPPAR
jgi:hypothetical protein